MAIYENLTEFQGKTVEDFDAEKPLGDPAKIAYRIRLDYEEGEGGATWVDKFSQLLEQPGAEMIESLIIGAWEEVSTGTESTPIVEALAAARDRLPRLKHLFFGDIIMEESEISWIQQGDLSPIFEAYPKLEHITIRGGMGLSLGRLHHERLRELIIQTGGLPPAVIHEVADAHLPSLEHLELWLGSPNYGGEATGEDLAAILRGEKFPKLKYLGLKDSEIADEVAGIVANSPILKQLDVLDLSLGSLSDDGARALLGCAEIRRLKKLDLHHHYISDEVMAQFDQLGINVDLSDQEDDGGDAEDRYIAVSE